MNTMGKVPWLVGRRTRNLARIRGGRPYLCCLSFLAFHVLTLVFCLLIEPFIRLATIRFARSGYVLKSTRGSGRAVQNPLRSLFSLTRTGFMLADVFHQVFWSNWTVSKACFSASSSSIVANLELLFDSPLYAEPVVVCIELHISLIVWTFGGSSGKAERETEGRKSRQWVHQEEDVEWEHNNGTLGRYLKMCWCCGASITFTDT